MKKETNLPEENKKRDAFKRFSQMSAAGLTVLSFSAFADVSAKQLPANIENVPAKQQSTMFAKMQTGKSFAIESSMFGHGESFTESPHNLYSNYTNSYSNSYSNSGYTNNYSNSCDIV